MTSPVLPRQECAITVLGGPTAVIDVGGLRIVSAPTFHDAGSGAHTADGPQPQRPYWARSV
jgi:hypothetical protein